MGKLTRKHNYLVQEIVFVFMSQQSTAISCSNVHANNNGWRRAFVPNSTSLILLHADSNHAKRYQVCRKEVSTYSGTKATAIGKGVHVINPKRFIPWSCWLENIIFYGWKVIVFFWAQMTLVTTLTVRYNFLILNFWNSTKYRSAWETPFKMENNSTINSLTTATYSAYVIKSMQDSYGPLIKNHYFSE